MFTEYVVLNAVRTVSAISAILVLLIQSRLPSRNLFVGLLSISIVILYGIRTGTSLAFDSTTTLQNHEGWCWANLGLTNYFIFVEHYASVFIAAGLWLLVQQKRFLEKHEWIIVGLILLFSMIPAILIIAIGRYLMTEKPEQRTLLVATRVDRCWYIGPNWLLWVAFLSWNFIAQALVTFFSLDVIRRLASTSQKARAVLNQPADVARDLEIAKEPTPRLIPWRFYLRILFLLFYCLFSSIYVNIDIALLLYQGVSNSSRDMYAVDNLDYLVALDGIVVFLIFGTSAEAKRHFWKPLFNGGRTPPK